VPHLCRLDRLFQLGSFAGHQIFLHYTLYTLLISSIKRTEENPTQFWGGSPYLLAPQDHFPLAKENWTTKVGKRVSQRISSRHVDHRNDSIWCSSAKVLQQALGMLNAV
jgi:hypothetical protein